MLAIALPPRIPSPDGYATRARASLHLAIRDITKFPQEKKTRRNGD
jgi:hypothetical protein